MHQVVSGVPGGIMGVLGVSGDFRGVPGDLRRISSRGNLGLSRSTRCSTARTLIHLNAYVNEDASGNQEPCFQDSFRGSQGRIRGSKGVPGASKWSQGRLRVS